jgi:hypothetical protein
MNDLPLDKRAPRFGWAPGSYLAECFECGSRFTGDKRAVCCAPCAYNDAGLLEARTVIERLLSSGQDVAAMFNPGPIPASEPTEADWTVAEWACAVEVAEAFLARSEKKG